MLPAIDGLLLAIDKPEGWTSHDVVAYIRKGLGVARVGHAGTLDPFATGLLLVAVGRIATRTISEWSDADKTYRAVIRFGIETDTLDRTGQQLTTASIPERAAYEKVVAGFIGEQMQMPPAFSAIKVGGRKAYVAARKGKPLELEPRPIAIRDISILEWLAPDVTMRIVCSKGTYIRAFARDFAHAAGSVAIVQELCRERIGEVSITSAVSPQTAVDCLRAGEIGTFAVRRWDAITSEV